MIIIVIFVRLQTPALGGHAVWILCVCRPGECHVNLPFPVFYYDLYGLLWTGLAIIMLRGTNPDNEGVVSFTTSWWLCGGIFRSCFGNVFILQLFGRSVLQRPYTMKNKIKHKSLSLLKVLQSLLHLPEQEQFVKTSAFLHERVTNYKWHICIIRQMNILWNS